MSVMLQAIGALLSLLSAADSTRRRNSFMESLRGRFVVKRFSRPFVEASGDRVELGLRVSGEVNSLR